MIAGPTVQTPILTSDPGAGEDGAGLAVVAFPPVRARSGGGMRGWGSEKWFVGWYVVGRCVQPSSRAGKRTHPWCLRLKICLTHSEIVLDEDKLVAFPNNLEAQGCVAYNHLYDEKILQSVLSGDFICNRSAKTCNNEGFACRKIHKWAYNKL